MLPPFFYFNFYFFFWDFRFFRVEENEEKIKCRKKRENEKGEEKESVDSLLGRITCIINIVAFCCRHIITFSLLLSHEIQERLEFLFC